MRASFRRFPTESRYDSVGLNLGYMFSFLRHFFTGDTCQTFGDVYGDIVEPTFEEIYSDQNNPMPSDQQQGKIFILSYNHKFNKKKILENFRIYNL